MPKPKLVAQFTVDGYCYSLKPIFYVLSRWIHWFLTIFLVFYEYAPWCSLSWCICSGLQWQILSLSSSALCIIISINAYPLLYIFTFWNSVYFPISFLVILFQAPFIIFSLHFCLYFFNPTLAVWTQSLKLMCLLLLLSSFLFPYNLSMSSL